MELKSYASGSGAISLTWTGSTTKRDRFGITERIRNTSLSDTVTVEQMRQHVAANPDRYKNLKPATVHGQCFLVCPCELHGDLLTFTYDGRTMVIKATENDTVHGWTFHHVGGRSDGKEVLNLNMLGICYYWMRNKDNVIFV